MWSIKITFRHCRTKKVWRFNFSHPSCLNIHEKLVPLDHAGVRNQPFSSFYKVSIDEQFIYSECRAPVVCFKISGNNSVSTHSPYHLSNAHSLLSIERCVLASRIFRGQKKASARLAKVKGKTSKHLGCLNTSPPTCFLFPSGWPLKLFKHRTEVDWSLTFVDQMLLQIKP